MFSRSARYLRRPSETVIVFYHLFSVWTSNLTCCASVQAAVEKVAEALGDDGRILVRESGTEPVVRVMVEEPEDALCEKYVDQVIEVIVSKGYKED